MGILKRAIAADASVVVSVLDATDIVNEIEKRSKTTIKYNKRRSWL